MPGVIIALAETPTVVQTCPLPVSQSGSAGVIMVWLGAKMQSWELLSEILISLREGLKKS